MSVPYWHFGYNLWQVRERRRLKSVQVAEYLGISKSEYSKYETGMNLPNDDILLEICRFLKIDVARAKRWIADILRQTNLIEKPLEDDSRYLKELANGIEAVGKSYEELTSHKITAEQKALLGRIQRDVPKMFDFPVLPMNYILILNTLLSREAEQARYFHEISDFMLEGENLAGFIAREYYLGPIILHIANSLIFKDKPHENIMDCFNQLTMHEFQEYLWLAVYRNDLYKVEQEIPVLQQMSDFNSLCALLARKFEPHLSKNINFNHLYQAVLVQGIGSYALFNHLHPSLIGRGEDGIKTQPDLNVGLNDELMARIHYELHAEVSCIIAKKWGFHPKALEIVLTHHHQPVKEVSPECALLKIINFIVDSDFPALPKKDIQDLLQAYPQVNISPDTLYFIFDQLKDMKKNLYERSSSILDDASPKVANYKGKSNYRKLFISPNFDHMGQTIIIPPKRSEFRFDPAYQNILLNVAYMQHLKFIKHVPTIRKDEPMRDFETRSPSIYLKLDYLTGKTIRELADKYKISSEEVSLRLFKR